LRGTRIAIPSIVHLHSWRLALRAAIVFTAVAQLVTGDVLYGLFCLAALGLTLAPARVGRRSVPIELEVLLLVVMVTDMTLGNLFGLYLKLPWYDKVLHLGSSVLIALVGFLAIYVLHSTERTRFHPWLDGAAILLVTLGLGALWELSEYTVDVVLGRRTQGSPMMDPHADTMLDLVFDTAGGIVGAIVGPRYMRRSQRARHAVAEVASLLDPVSSSLRELPPPARP
jgi:hypothetical protein